VSSQAVEIFGNKIRVRVCGLFYRGDDLLLMNHKGLYGHDFWAPPGGGLEFGEKVENALKREFFEECSLTLTGSKFLFACEFVRPPLHAIELFFKIEASGEPQLGQDPEMGDNQLLTSLKFWSPEAVRALPSTHRHGIFNHLENPMQLPQMHGFYPLPNM
jgi:8-oxo-dGTP diphosphatase